MSAFTPFKTWIGTTVPAATTPDATGAEKLPLIQSASTRSFTLLALAQWLVRTPLVFVQTAVAAADAAIRTLLAKMGEHYSPEDFKNDDGTNVLGNGVQDDTTGLQKFISFVLTNGKQGIATGTYRTTATIIFSGTKGSLFLQGSTIKPDAAVLVAVQYGTSAALFSFSCVYGLLVDRSAYSGATENIGLLYKNVSTVSFYNCDSRYSKYNHVLRPDTGDRASSLDFYSCGALEGFYNIWYDPLNTGGGVEGFANENNWWGGRMRTGANSVNNLHMPNHTSNNNNRFRGVNFEINTGATCAIGAYINSIETLVDNCRFEGAYTDVDVKFGEDSERCRLIDPRNDVQYKNLGTSNIIDSALEGITRSNAQNGPRSVVRLRKLGNNTVVALGALTVDTTSGSKVTSWSAVTGLAVGDFVNLPGAVQMGRVEDITGTDVTLDIAAYATVAGVTPTKVQPPTNDITDEFSASGDSYVQRLYMGRFGTTSFFQKAYWRDNLVYTLDGNGRISLSTVGSTGGLMLGGDAHIYRGAANVLQLAAGDSFRPETNQTILGDSTHQWRVFNSIFATASLPAAGASADGLLIIEDVGAGDRNLILYAGGERFRIDGGVPF